MEVVVVGVFNIVGWFMLLELLLVGCIVIICYCFIWNLEDYVCRVDLLVVVVGKFKFIFGEWVKFGFIVIDVGINCGDDGKLSGDIGFDDVVEWVVWIMSVLGGVGFLIVVILFENILIVV